MMTVNNFTKMKLLSPNWFPESWEQEKRMLQKNIHHPNKESNNNKRKHHNFFSELSNRYPRQNGGVFDWFRISDAAANKESYL